MSNNDIKKAFQEILEKNPQMVLDAMNRKTVKAKKKERKERIKRYKHERTKKG